MNNSVPACPINLLETMAASIPELNKTNEKLTAAITSNNSITSEIGSHLALSGGKRLRPLLTILSGNCFNPDKNKLIATATAIELIHLASLVHDDIIDKSSLRRGRASVNAKWGEKTAVLMGDFLFAKAFGILAEEKLTHILQLVVYCIQQMCDGEIEQEKFKFHWQQTYGDYYRRIYQKTALLIATCCEAGAIIGQAEQREIDLLRQYGLHLGYAFQITDDLLDFKGKDTTLGKPTGNDLAQGNLTLPVIMLLKNPQWSNWLAANLENKSLGEQELLKIQQLIHETGALKASFAKAFLHLKKANEKLLLLPPSPHKTILSSLTELVAHRTH